VYSLIRKKDHTFTPRILVVGLGGGGSNSIRRLRNIGVYGVETIAMNTDIRHLEKIDADLKVLLGKKTTRGLGAGGRPEIGEQCAMQSRAILDELFTGANLTFITVGMGGGTGTGLAPVVAEVAKKKGSIVIAFATIPFRCERGRFRNALYGLEKLKKKCDSIIILDNNKLLELVPELPVDQAFGAMDAFIADTIKNIVECITEKSLINIDFADLKSVMASGGISTMAYYENSANDPQKIIIETLNNPFFNVDYSGASGALIHISMGPEIPIKVADQIVTGLADELDPEANIIYGMKVSPELEGKIKVVSIITGVQSKYLCGPTTAPITTKIKGQFKVK
jgi:cell division protein FtsZ